MPKGFIADGFEMSNSDFGIAPAWIAYEYVYATHKFDYKSATRNTVDLFMFNSYPDEL